MLAKLRCFAWNRHNNMTGLSQEDIRGLEYDWLAADQFENVALFTTAGTSYVPEAFLKDTASHELAIENTLGLSTSTVALFSPKLKPGLQNIWLEFSNRGFFGFDADFLTGGYNVVSAPQKPIKLHDLPRTIATKIAEIKLSDVNFGDCVKIEKGSILCA